MRRRMILLALSASAMILAGVPATAAADARVLPPEARPYGQGSAEWAAEWWQWALAQPASTNPIVDETGAQCANDQSGPVWFLAGAFSEGIERECAIPAGRALFFPIINVVTCAFPSDPPEQQTEEYLRGLVNPIAESAEGLTLTIDAAAVANVKQRFYTESALFGMTLGPDNLFGLPDGQVIDPCADAGYYVMLPPLPRGEHTIEFSGSFPGFFSLSVSYELTVG